MEQEKISNMRKFCANCRMFIEVMRYGEKSICFFDKDLMERNIDSDEYLMTVAVKLGCMATIVKDHVPVTYGAKVEFPMTGRQLNEFYQSHTHRDKIKDSKVAQNVIKKVNECIDSSDCVLKCDDDRCIYLTERCMAEWNKKKK